MRDERWVSAPKLTRVVRDAMRDADIDTERQKVVLARVRKYVNRLPEQPPLVGVTEAARILKVPKPRIMRFRAQNRLPEALSVDGPSAPVYIRGEIEAFAREVQEGRDLRRVDTHAHNVAGMEA